MAKKNRGKKSTAKKNHNKKRNPNSNQNSSLGLSPNAQTDNTQDDGGTQELSPDQQAVEAQDDNRPLDLSSNSQTNDTQNNYQTPNLNGWSVDEYLNKKSASEKFTELFQNIFSGKKIYVQQVRNFVTVLGETLDQPAKEHIASLKNSIVGLFLKLTPKEGHNTSALSYTENERASISPESSPETSDDSQEKKESQESANSEDFNDSQALDENQERDDNQEQSNEITPTPQKENFLSKYTKSIWRNAVQSLSFGKQAAIDYAKLKWGRGTRIAKVGRKRLIKKTTSALEFARDKTRAAREFIIDKTEPIRERTTKYSSFVVQSIKDFTNQKGAQLVQFGKNLFTGSKSKEVKKEQSTLDEAKEKAQSLLEKKRRLFESKTADFDKVKEELEDSIKKATVAFNTRRGKKKDLEKLPSKYEGKKYRNEYLAILRKKRELDELTIEYEKGLSFDFLLGRIRKAKNVAAVEYLAKIIGYFTPSNNEESVTDNADLNLAPFAETNGVDGEQEKETEKQETEIGSHAKEIDEALKELSNIVDVIDQSTSEVESENQKATETENSPTDTDSNEFNSQLNLSLNPSSVTPDNQFLIDTNTSSLNADSLGLSNVSETSDVENPEKKTGEELREGEDPALPKREFTQEEQKQLRRESLYRNPLFKQGNVPNTDELKNLFQRVKSLFRENLPQKKIKKAEVLVFHIKRMVTVI